MTYANYNVAAQRHALQQQAASIAKQYANVLQHQNGSTPPTGPYFVLPPQANVYAHQHPVPVPPQFVQQVAQVARQPIARSDRNPRVTGKIDGRPFDMELEYEGTRHFHGSTPLPELMAAAQDVFAAWPDSAKGTVRAKGTRADHAHPDKEFSFERDGNVFRITASHRRNSDLVIYADGSVYLGGRRVTEQSSPVVFRRLASRLNGAVSFLVACNLARKDAPPDVGVQAVPPRGEDREVQVEAPATRSVGMQTEPSSAFPLQPRADVKGPIRTGPLPNPSSASSTSYLRKAAV